MNTRFFRTLCALALLTLAVSIVPSALADTITYKLTMSDIGTNIPVTGYSFDPTGTTFTFTVPNSNPAAQLLFDLFQKVVVDGCATCKTASSEVSTFDNGQLSLTDTFTDSIIIKLVGSSLGSNEPPSETATFFYHSMTETTPNPNGTPGSVPEPSSLLLLGSGLTVASAGIHRQLRKGNKSHVA